ncbi:signal peptidase I, partial [mine drainage metagenome]
MARRIPVEADDVDEEDEEDDEEEEGDDAAEERPRRRRSSPRRRSPPPSRRGGRPPPVRRWRGAADDRSAAEPEEDEPDRGVDAGTKGTRRRARSERARRARERYPVYFRARDSLYFGPLVALAIIVLLVVAMYAFTENWPPAYVVESPSMQHGPRDVLGVINEGDIVLAEKVPTSSIVTYVWGERTGYSTYGEYGDVVLYWPDGATTTPIIHRALIYLTFDPVVNGYNISVPSNVPCGTQPDAVYSTSNSIGPGGTDCGTVGLTGTLTLYHVGWADANVSIPLSPGVLGAHSGFVTMGDNNFVQSGPPNAGCSGVCSGRPDQDAGLSTLVAPSWVLGVARGMLPWFGSLKLLLENSPYLQYLPSQSWQFMGLTVVGLLLLAFGIHYALRADGIEDPRRRALEEAEDDADDLDEDDPPRPSRGSRMLHRLR